MLEGTVAGLMLLGAFLAALLGMAWLALAKDVHWDQVRPSVAQTRRRVVLLQSFGACALAVSLGLCLAVDHASMAALVWVMMLAAGALLVALALAWRPHWLGCTLGPARGS